MSLPQSDCRPCRGRGYNTKQNNASKTEMENNLSQLGLHRQDSRMLASKVRYSILKNIASPECPSKSNQTPPECFIRNQYALLDKFEGDELEEVLAKLDLADLENIVSQENKDIACALTMAKKNNVDVNVTCPEEGSPTCRRLPGDILSRVCDAEEDMSAETIAKMMYAAEVKSVLTAPPQVIFNLLFDDLDVEPLPVNSAAPDTPLSHIVVPLGAPNSLTDPDLEDAARISADKTLVSPHSDDTSETSEDVHEDVISQVLRVTTPSPETLEDLLLGTEHHSLGDFDLLMEPKEPAYQSLYQLRGSQPPSWFPDYYALYPNSPFKTFEKIENPMGVLHKAWENVQPAELNPSTDIHMIGL